MRRIPGFLTLAAGLLAMSSGLARAKSSLLFDARSGAVIESENPFERRFPASLTKLMTTYVAFRAVQAGEVTLLSPVRLSKNAAKEPPSKMGYKPGSVLTLDNALKILMVKSANDVATAVGESLAGSQAAFAARMNAESARLGMTGSHWVNAHGLHDEAQYTTARDLAVLAAALRNEFPHYADYFSIEGIKAGKVEIPSHNTLIARFEGADGMKTGYTCAAGYNLVGSATRGGRTLMAVVIGATSVDERAEKAASMLVRGFVAGGAGAMTLATMPSPAAPGPAVSMYDALCSKEARAERAKRWKELKENPDQEPEPSPYLPELTRPRVLVEVGLGGATGPVPIGVAGLDQEDTSDIPLPTWRPDLPPPPGAEPVVMQGDAAGTRS